MSEIPEKSLNCSVNEIRVTSLERRMDSVKKDVKHIKDQNDSQNEVLAKVDTVIEFMIEDRKEQKEINKESIKTLKSMDDNLTTLNRDMQNIKQEVTETKEDVDKLKNITTINWTSLMKGNIEKLVSGVVGGALILGAYYLLTKL